MWATEHLLEASHGALLCTQLWPLLDTVLAVCMCVRACVRGCIRGCVHSRVRAYVLATEEMSELPLASCLYAFLQHMLRNNLASRASFWGPLTPLYNEEITPLGLHFFSCASERKDCDQGPKWVSTKKIREYILQLFLQQFSQSRDYKLGLCQSIPYNLIYGINIGKLYVQGTEVFIHFLI